MIIDMLMLRRTLRPYDKCEVRGECSIITLKLHSIEIIEILYSLLINYNKHPPHTRTCVHALYRWHPGVTTSPARSVVLKGHDAGLVRAARSSEEVGAQQWLSRDKAIVTLRLWV